MKLICKGFILILVVIFYAALCGAENNSYDKPLFEDEHYVFLQKNNTLLIYVKWKPHWILFDNNFEIINVSKISKNKFALNQKEAFLNEFKSLIYFKEDNLVMQGEKITNFSLNSKKIRNTTPNDWWKIERKNNTIIVNYYWQSENILYDFYINLDK